MMFRIRPKTTVAVVEMPSLVISAHLRNIDCGINSCAWSIVTSIAGPEASEWEVQVQQHTFETEPVKISALPDAPGPAVHAARPLTKEI